MNVNRNGIIVAGVNGFNHTKNKKIIQKKHHKKEGEPKTFVSLLKEYAEGSNQHVIQPYDAAEVKSYTDEGWLVEEVWNEKEKKETYVAHEY